MVLLQLANRLLLCNYGLCIVHSHLNLRCLSAHQINLLLKDIIERGEAQIPADLFGIRYLLTRHHGPVRCLHLWPALSRIRYLRPNVISHIRLGLLHDDLLPLHLQARPQVVGLGGAIPYGKTQLEYHAVLGIRISEHLPEHWACAGSQRVSIELAEDAEGRTQGAPRVSLCNPIIFQRDFRAPNSRVIRYPPHYQDVQRVEGSFLDFLKPLSRLKRYSSRIRPDCLRNKAFEPYFEQLGIRLSNDKVATGRGNL